MKNMKVSWDDNMKVSWDDNMKVSWDEKSGNKIDVSNHQPNKKPPLGDGSNPTD